MSNVELNNQLKISTMETGFEDALDVPILVDVQPSNKDRRRRVPRWVFVLVFLGAFGLAFGVYYLATGIEKIGESVNDCQSIADSFMKAMAEGKEQEAYNLFSDEVQQQLTLSEVQEFNKGPYSGLYRGYKSLEVEGITFNSDRAIGKILELNGPVAYIDGTMGYFNAIFQSEAGDWHLYNIEVEVPMEKINW